MVGVDQQPRLRHRGDAPARARPVPPVDPGTIRQQPLALAIVVLGPLCALSGDRCSRGCRPVDHGINTASRTQQIGLLLSGVAAFIVILWARQEMPLHRVIALYGLGGLMQRRVSSGAPSWKYGVALPTTFVTLGLLGGRRLRLLLRRGRRRLRLTGSLDDYRSFFAFCLLAATLTVWQARPQPTRRATAGARRSSSAGSALAAYLLPQHAAHRRLPRLRRERRGPPSRSRRRARCSPADGRSGRHRRAVRCSDPRATAWASSPTGTTSTRPRPGSSRSTSSSSRSVTATCSAASSGSTRSPPTSGCATAGRPGPRGHDHLRVGPQPELPPRSTARRRPRSSSPRCSRCGRWRSSPPTPTGSRSASPSDWSSSPRPERGGRGDAETRCSRTGRSRPAVRVERPARVAVGAARRRRRHRWAATALHPAARSPPGSSSRRSSRWSRRRPRRWSTAPTRSSPSSGRPTSTPGSRSPRHRRGALGVIRLAAPGRARLPAVADGRGHPGAAATRACSTRTHAARGTRRPRSATVTCKSC